MSATLAFSQRPNASVSGALEVLPSDFIFMKAGLSFRVRRIHTEMPSSTMDSRKGMRQPQAANSSSPSQVRVPRMISSERNRPSVAVVWIHEV
ncbi:hypothetical protein D3C84_1042990 [compost metagenome]